jgi:hypothetical protein
VAVAVAPAPASGASRRARRTSTTRAAAAPGPAQAAGNDNLSPGGARTPRSPRAGGAHACCAQHTRASAILRALTQRFAHASPNPAARLLLLLVPLCWGTYNPSLRLIYSQPHPPGPGELSATRLVLALIPFVPTLFAIARGVGTQQAALGGAEGGEAVPPAGGTTDWRAVVKAALELGSYNFLCVTAARSARNARTHLPHLTHPRPLPLPF